MDVSKIAGCLVRSVSTNEEISELKPQLDAHGVRLIGIGVEELGLEDFQNGQFFSGELFVDAKKETYSLLGFKRFNIFNIFPAIFSRPARAYYAKAQAAKVGGDLKGDGMQNGGSLVVEKELADAMAEQLLSGKTLLSYKQESPAAHVDLAEVLKALGIDEPLPRSTAGDSVASCDGDV